MKEAKRWFNCWWTHKWSNWKDSDRGNVTCDGNIIGRYLFQERRCEVCNKVELKCHSTEVDD